MISATETEVTFKGEDGLVLSGTFEMPAHAANARISAMLLIPGSGPTDRNGNSPLLTVKIDLLKEIADRLAASGIASLRFDKRVLPRYRPNWPTDISKMADFIAFEKFVGDAKGAYRFLLNNEELDHSRVGILGHSEGALLTLQIASDLANTPESPKAIVLLGSTGRKMGEVLHDQLAAKLPVQLGSAEAAKPYLAYSDAACAAAAAGKPYPPNPPAGLVPLYNPSTLKLLGAYCRIDPATLAINYTGSALAVNGGDDTQVSPLKDTPKIEAALKARKTGVYEVLIVPKASHNLKSTAAGDKDAFTGPIVPSAIDKIISFLGKHL